MKKPWLSKTIIINTILGVSIALSAFVPALASVKSFIENNALAIGAGWSVLGVILRTVSHEKIVLGE
jgi:hypothetical protein